MVLICCFGKKKTANILAANMGNKEIQGGGIG
jgi:hypothetical protein